MTKLSLLRHGFPLLQAICLVVALLPLSVRTQESKLPPHPETDAPSRLKALDFTPFASELSRLGSSRAGQIHDLVIKSTIPEVQAAMAAGKVTSEELTLFFLQRIQRMDEALRSYIEINPGCLAEARESDRSRAAGQHDGPFHGIPINIKDNIDTALPLHTTAGAEILLDHAPARDAEIVSQLRGAGAVILGKASLSELAGVLTTDPPGYNAVSGIGANPYQKGLPVSGSSSGSAISTSALLTMVSVGTETSGSLISPGSMNGVIAMKPSRGLVSGDGIVPLVRYQDSAGPIARNVTDAALMLDAIDNSTTGFAGSLDARALQGLTVGLLRADITGSKLPAKNVSWLKLIEDGLGQSGSIHRDVQLEGRIDLLPVIFLGLAQETIGYMKAAGRPANSLAELQDYNTSKPETRIPRRQNMIELGSRMVAELYGRQEFKDKPASAVYETMALRVRDEAAAILRKAFTENEVELLVSLGNRHSEFYATAGYPAITVPLGVDQNGAPNGITFIGKPGEDAKLLARAFAFEQATRYRVNPPAAGR